MRKNLFRLAAAGVAGLVTIGMAGGAARAAPRTDTGYQLNSALSNLCWQVVDGNPGNGVHIRLTTTACNSVTWDNQWTVEAKGTRPEVMAGVPVYWIHSRETGKCLDVRDGSRADRATLQVWDCNPGWQQLFRLTQDLDVGYLNYYRIEPGYETDMCVMPNTPTPDYGVPANTELVQRPCALINPVTTVGPGVDRFQFTPATA